MSLPSIGSEVLTTKDACSNWNISCRQLCSPVLSSKAMCSVFSISFKQLRFSVI